MNSGEAIKVLKRMKSPDMEPDEFTATQMAIKSLEAWQKVIRDIQESRTMICNSDIIAGYDISLIIIKKYLKGVEK